MNTKPWAEYTTYLSLNVPACIWIVIFTVKISRTTSTPSRRTLLYIHLRKFLAKHKLQLECACVDRPKLERDHDLFLMDAVCAKAKAQVSDADVRIIDYYRNYLEVQRLSDICTANRQFIIKSVWDGDCSITQSQSLLEEIIQDKPRKKEWT